MALEGVTPATGLARAGAAARGVVAAPVVGYMGVTTPAKVENELS